MPKMDVENLSSFDFTRHWFRKRNMATFSEKVYPMFANKPITYLEIGVFEGQSIVWMLQHVLTHSDSRVVGIDPWLATEKMNNTEMDDIMGRAHINVANQVVSLSGMNRFTKDGLPKDLLIRANSSEILRRMVRGEGYAGIRRSNLDLCMIDGGHNSLAVLDDARLVFRLLKPGGVILFDDVVNRVPKQDHVEEGIALFLAEVGSAVKLLWKDRHMEGYIKE